jgi:hypothetical protein
MKRSGGSPRNALTSSTGPLPGVATRSSVPPRPAAPASGGTSAFSTFARSRSGRSDTIASSPDAASTWNSCDSEPPIAPVPPRPDGT